MNNQCVSCGEIIPEGRQICPDCECGHIVKQIGTAYTLVEDGEWHSKPIMVKIDEKDND